MGQEIRDRALIALNQYPLPMEENDSIRIDLEGARLQTSVRSLRDLFSAFSQRQENGYFEIEGKEAGSGDWGENKALMGIDDAAREIIKGRFAIKENYWDRKDIPKCNQDATVL